MGKGKWNGRIRILVSINIVWVSRLLFYEIIISLRWRIIDFITLDKV